MKLNNADRKRLFNQGRSINSNLGDLFQNEMDLEVPMIDQEFDQVSSFEFEIQLYKDQLQKLKITL